jgi:hypothetical protein
MNLDGHEYRWSTRTNNLDTENTSPEGGNMNPNFLDLG